MGTPLSFPKPLVFVPLFPITTRSYTPHPSLEFYHHITPSFFQEVNKMFSRSLLCAGILLTSHGAHATDHASMKASPSSTTAFRLLAEDDRLFRQQLDLTMVFKRHCNSCKGPMPEGIRGTYDACQCGKTDWVPKNAPFNCDLTQLPGQWWCDLEMPNNDPEEQKVDFAPELRAVNRIKAVTLRRMRDLPRHVEALVHGDIRWVLELVYEDEHVDVLAYCAPIPQCPELGHSRLRRQRVHPRIRVLRPIVCLRVPE